MAKRSRSMGSLGRSAPVRTPKAMGGNRKLTGVGPLIKGGGSFKTRATTSRGKVGVGAIRRV